MSNWRDARWRSGDEWGRAGYGGDGHGGDGLDFSPRTLRRMQRARLTSEEPQPPPPRQVEIPRRVMPLVPWWWDEYVRTGAAKNAANTESRAAGSDGCISDGSSSVSSTISLTAAPHLFRLSCGGMPEASRTSNEAYSRQLRDSGAAATPKRSNAAADKDQPIRSNESLARVAQPAGFPQGAALDFTGCLSGDVAIELIHAAAQLVDSLDSWPEELGAHDASNIPVESQRSGMLSSSGGGGPAAEYLTVTSQMAAVSAAGLSGKRAKQQKASGGTPADPLQSGSSQGLLTFVSAVVAAPSDGEVECIRGFELLEGPLHVLFSSMERPAESLPEGPQRAEPNKGSECMSHGLDAICA